MKTILWVGLMALGLGSAACRDRPEPVEVEGEARGPGAQGKLEPAPGADMGEVQRLERLQREQYEAIADDVGVQTWPGERRVEVPGDEPSPSGQGGSGQGGAEQEPPTP